MHIYVCEKFAAKYFRRRKDLIEYLIKNGFYFERPEAIAKQVKSLNSRIPEDIAGYKVTKVKLI